MFYGVAMVGRGGGSIRRWWWLLMAVVVFGVVIVSGVRGILCRCDGGGP